MPGSGRDGTRHDTRFAGRSLVAMAIAGALVSAAPSCASRSHLRGPDVTWDVSELQVSVVAGVPQGAALSAEEIHASGPGQPEVSVVRAHGGQVRAELGDDGGPVLRFPPFRQSSHAPVAIIAVTSDDPDWLQPGDDTLLFGADLTVDAVSDGSARDNGDNVVQRGLFGAPAQFKLQVDHRRPSCLVRGDAGMVLTKSSVTLRPRSWYRVTCRRIGDQVELTVSRLDHGVLVHTVVDRRRGEIGSVTFPSQTPLSVGGKLGPDGGPVRDATDQYDGSLGRVHVTLVRPELS